MGEYGIIMDIDVHTTVLGQSQEPRHSKARDHHRIGAAEGVV